MDKKIITEKLATLITDMECNKYHNCDICPEKDYLSCQQFHLAKNLVESDALKLIIYEVLSQIEQDIIEKIDRLIQLNTEEIEVLSCHWSDNLSAFGSRKALLNIREIIEDEFNNIISKKNKTKK